GASALADRMASCLEAFAQRDRSAVRTALAKSIERLPHLDGAALLRTFGRLGHLDVAWDLVDDPMAARVDGLVAGVQPGDVYGNLTPEQASVFSLVGTSVGRARLPSLEGKFQGLHPRSRALVM